MKRRDSLHSSVFIPCVESLLSPRLDQGLKKYLMVNGHTYFKKMVREKGVRLRGSSS